MAGGRRAAATAYRPRARGRPRASTPRSARPDLPWNSKWPMLWPWASRAAALLKLPLRVLPRPPCGHQQLHVRATASSRRPPIPAARPVRSPGNRLRPAAHVGSGGRGGAEGAWSRRLTANEAQDCRHEPGTVANHRLQWAGRAALRVPALPIHAASSRLF